MKPIEKIMVALAVTLLAAIIIAPFVDNLVSPEGASPDNPIPTIQYAEPIGPEQNSIGITSVVVRSPAGEVKGVYVPTVSADPHEVEFTEITGGDLP